MEKIILSDYYDLEMETAVAKYYKCKFCKQRESVRKYTGRQQDDAVRYRPDMIKVRKHLRDKHKEVLR